jgi:hypothetical protein
MMKPLPTSRALRTLAAAALIASPASAGTPFAASVVSFDPAPGQFVNHPAFSDPLLALGPPLGGGVWAAGNESVVSLGGFGGTITLAFDHTVEDHPLNPMGLDAIVFGNAYWVTNPDRRWGEAGVLEISLDVNGDGLANDPWYLIPGSHLGPAPIATTTQTWDDATADPTHPPFLAAWIPPGRTGTWQTTGQRLPAAPFHTTPMVNPLAGTGTEGVHGYADVTPTLLLGDLDGDDLVDDAAIDPADFYTVPDDPHAVGVTPGSGGGDAFDIAWAIDPQTGEPANLPAFDFIRITTGVHHVAGILGELSTEIDAVADARPDPRGDHEDDGDIDLADAAALQRCYGTYPAEDDTCPRLEWEPDGLVTLDEAAQLLARMMGPR